jgi:hypothetical protein
MAAPSGHHEFRADEEVKTSSNRSFGLVFGGAFALLAFWSWYKAGHFWPVHIAISAVCTVLALTRPAILEWPNRAWTKLGLVLSRIVNPIVMGLIFFVLFTPVGVIRRLRGHDPLRLKFHEGATSYWIVRDPPGPAPDSMNEQF